MEGDGPDAVTVAIQNAYTHSCARVPQPNRPVIAATGQQAAIGAKGNGAHPAGMILQYAQTLSGTPVGHIPEADGPVVTAAGEILSIGTEGDGPDAIGMSPASEHGRTI